MKIAFVCPRFYPSIGGVETVVFELAQNLAAKGMDVTVLTQTRDTKLAEKEQMHNIKVRRFHEIGFSELKISVGLFRYLQKNSEKYDVIHVQNYHAFPALSAAITKKRPIIFSPHYHGAGHTAFTNLLQYPYRFIGKFIFSRSDTILCDSYPEAQMIQKHFRILNRIIVIPLGVDVEGIQKAKKYENMSPYILTVGRLESYKNVELIIRSLQYINSDVSLKIVGDGPELQKLKDIAYKLNLSNRINFLNNISNEELFRLLKTAKAYVTMSSMEAYGISLLEAVAVGTGIVASNIPAHRAMIKRFKINNIALLDPNSSPKELADSIKIVMKSPAHTKEKLPSWELVTEQTLIVYKNALNR